MESLPKISGLLVGDVVVCDSSDVTRELYEKSSFGEPVGKSRFQYALFEALYLFEKERMDIHVGKKQLTYDLFLKKALKEDPHFVVRYAVYADLRKRGYIVKTALKFGADFRVYDRGVKPGDDHSLWVVFAVAESNALTWFEFSAKNRVAHSTRKKLLLGIVDAEGACTYYETSWIRP